MIHLEILPMNQLGNRHNLKPLFLDSLENRVQYLRGVFRIIVEQNDGAIAQMLMLQHLPDFRLRSLFLPIQTVSVGNKNYSLCSQCPLKMNDNPFYLICFLN